MDKFKIALQLYTVRDDLEKDFKATLSKVKEMGYEGVEFAGLYGHSADEVKAMCEQAGVVPLSAHIPYDELKSDPEKVISDYHKIGCPYFAIPYLAPEYRPGTDGFAEVIENARKFGEIGKKYGMTLLYHNHDFEFQMIGGKYALDILYDEVPKEFLQTELDVCWVNVGGEDPAEYLLKYSGRAPVLHLKDFYGEKSDDMYELIGIDRKAPERPKNFEFRPVGYGCQDFAKILAAAEKAGTEWVVVEQDRPSMDKTPMECAEMSIKYLNTL